MQSVGSIVKHIGTVVHRMRTTPVDPNAPGAGAPYYMYGHRLEIANRVTEKINDKVYKYQRYPLIALRLDTEEPKRDAGVTYYNLNIAILAYTDANYNAEQRVDNVLEPVLQPLYERFMTELRKSYLFMWPGNPQVPEHTAIWRPYWGITSLEGNVKQVFADPLDAIEIVDLRINQRQKKC